MRQVTIGTLLLVLCAGLVQADPREKHAAPIKVQDRMVEIKKVADSKPLFYALGSDVSVVGIRELQFRVEMDHRLVLRETIAMTAGEGMGSSIELLAARPDLLDRLYAIAKEHQVAISILGDGRQLQTFSFQDFVTYNRGIKTSVRLQLQPRKSSVEILDPSAGLVAKAPTSSSTKPGLRSVSASSEGWRLDPACVDWCEAQRQDCLVSGACGNMVICDPCNEAYDSCVNYSCWVWTCTDPKSQSTSYQVVPVNAYWYGWACLSDWFNFLEYYDSLQIIYKVYQVTHTEYCNGTSSDSSVYLYDTYQYCSRPTGIPCSFGQGYVSNICY